MVIRKSLVSVWIAFLLLVTECLIAEFCSFQTKQTLAQPPSLSGTLKKGFAEYALLKEKPLVRQKGTYFLSYDNVHEITAECEQAAPEVRTNKGKSRTHKKKKILKKKKSKLKQHKVRLSRGAHASQPLKKSHASKKISNLQKRVSKRRSPEQKVKYPSRSWPTENVVIRPSKVQVHWKKIQREPLFCWPVDPATFWVSSLFGPRKLRGGLRRFHAGIDMAAARGTFVYAAESGIVTEAAYSEGYGNYILIAHNRKFKTRYAHLDKILVNVGQTMASGQCIGRVGATGFVRKSRAASSASHLHFEIYMKGKPVDPLLFLA